MTDEFPEAFKRMPEHDKRVKTFDELRANFRGWAGNKAPLTKGQDKGLAIEASRLGISVPNREEKTLRKGKMITRFRNVVTGYFMKSKTEISVIPIWRTKDITYSKGISYNSSTGETLKLRDSKGHYLKRDEWTLTDKSGTVKYIGRVEGKSDMTKMSDSVKQSKASKKQAEKESRNREYTENIKKGKN